MSARAADRRPAAVDSPHLVATTAGSRRNAPGRLPGLDVVRGMAVALVMLRHTFPEQLSGAGIVGVVMFFALSGFLITSILLSEIALTGRIDFARFYRNRALRLLPALLLLLAVTVIVQHFLRTDPATTLRTVLISGLYLADLPLARHGLPALGHLWSLAIEEQFYLGWPLVLLFATRRGSTTQALIAVGFTAAAADLAELVLHRHQPTAVYGSPTTWALCLLLGSAAAVHRDRLTAALTRGRRRRRALIGAAALVLVVASVVPNAKEHVLTYVLGPTIVPGAALIVLFALLPSSAAAGPARVLARLGTISYALYLWSYALLTWLNMILPEVPQPVRGLAAVALALLTATGSWTLVERPLLRYRRPPETRAH